MTCSGIDTSIPSVINFLKGVFEGNYTYNDYQLDIVITTRPCIIGEGLRSNGACYTCPKGTYLLVAPTVPTDCIVCNSE